VQSYDATNGVASQKRFKSSAGGSSTGGNHSSFSNERSKSFSKYYHNL
jgi:hypothetical protein